MQQSPSLNASSFSYNQQLTAFYGTRMFITLIARPNNCHCPESGESSLRPPILFLLRSVLILSFYFLECLSNGFCPPSFLTTLLCAFLFFRQCCSQVPSYFMLFYYFYIMLAMKFCMSSYKDLSGTIRLKYIE
jgi:hypothetical protein